jgi:hypothetical protein
VAAVTARAACGAEVANGRQCRREVAGGDRATAVSPLTRGPLASEPCHFSEFFKIFKLPHFDIRIGDLPNVKTSSNFACR